ncbi:Methyltransferase-like protein 23 [Mortierella antarctica]|nr:Methyltransferase-like protein 23 [Mortierella alpina]KAF9985128.1 Methyltransferase-like protein 23 [Mortierella antarctica]
MDPNATRPQACKQYHYESDKGNTTVEVIELLDADFGLYVWPSSLVLAEYIHHRLDIFTGTREKPKVILELGAGTALPSLLLARAPSHDSRFLITTDRTDVPEILDNVRDAFRKNGVHSFYPEDTRSKVMVRGLNWGDFSLASARNADGGLLQLLGDVSQMKYTKDGSVISHKIDVILGSDTFYNPPDFEPLLNTVSYIVHRHNPDCVFLSTYQNRSAKRNIDHMLQKWGLEGRLIDWEDFRFDMGKFVTEDGDDCEVNTSTECEGSDSDPEDVKNPDSDDDERWLRLAKQEVSRDMAMASGLPAGGPRPSLVDYSSDSDDDDGAEYGMDKIPDDSTQDVDSDASTSKVGAGHRLGDGGALSSVHLLWICKRGRGDNIVVWRKPGAGA